MINNLERQKDALEEEIAELDVRNDEADANNIALQQQKDELLKKLQELEDKLFDKRKSLGEYNEKLNKLADIRAGLEHDKDNLVRDINQLKKEQIDAETVNMSVVGYDIVTDKIKEMVEEIDNFKASLPGDLRIKFDNTVDTDFLEDIARRRDDVVAVSTGLYLGYVEEVLKHANAHGGGGGSTGNWGRKEDEDDESFRHRCFLMGSMLMKAVKTKLKKLVFNIKSHFYQLIFARTANFFAFSLPFKATSIIPTIYLGWHKLRMKA